MSLDAARAGVVAEARSWLGTPYHHMGRVKGGGCDCLTFVAEVYERSGVLPHIDVGFYRPDFMKHRGEERYLEGCLAHGVEVAAPQPGDIALFRPRRWSLVFCHSGIVTDWPEIIHAAPRYGVMMGNGTQGLLRGSSVRFFSPFRER